ncbi:MAG: hypothetical protein AMXMBFR23_01970 [Chloroflexota bacterium]
MAPQQQPFAQIVLREPALGRSIPVIAVVDRSQLAAVGPGVKGHDFVLKPVDEHEMRARMCRLISDRTGHDNGLLMQHGSLTIDLERHKVMVDDELVDLTYTE